MARPVLITGASGLLGRDLVKAFKRSGWNVTGTALRNTSPPDIVELDLEEGSQIEAVLDQVKPDVIVHSAANRFPDKCAADPKLASAVNVDATTKLAQLARARSILLIYISTDYVFPGRPGEAPYFPHSPTDPTNTYGETKRDGEVAVLKETGGGGDTADGDDSLVLGLVLRVPLLYGHVSEGQSSSAVHPLVDAVYKAQESRGHPGARSKVDDHAVRYPTCTEDVARVCADVARLFCVEKGPRHVNSDGGGGGGGAAALSAQRKLQDKTRILQFSAEQKFTKYEMCEALAGILALPVDGLERFDPSKEDGEQDGPARPYDCHLDTGALKDLGIDVTCVDFVTWWKRELKAFRH